MIHISWRRSIAAFALSSFALVAWGSTGAASRPSAPVGMELDHLIPRAQWGVVGLDKLTAPEQQALASEITDLLETAQSTETGSSAQNDRSQWRKLHRRMSKDDVRNLLGEPARVSVSRFYEEWDYPRGTVIFDGKGRLDSWSEL
jgi:hypothetical protein